MGETPWEFKSLRPHGINREGRMNALVTGATGFIGRALVKRLGGATVLTRDPVKAKRVLGDVPAHAWEPTAGPAPAAAFRGVDVVFNLMGDPIAQGRWSPAKLKRIRESRVIGTANLVAGMRACDDRPKVLVSASAIGFYGSRGDEVLDETAANGSDTLAGVCRGWEAAALAAGELGVRVACVRNGIVLRKEGGALAQMLLPFRLGLGGRLGSGAQWMSWVHLDDLLALYLFVAQHAEGRGIFNGVAPQPVTNADFTRALAAAVHRPAVFPMPAAMVRLAFGGVAEVMLGSQRVLPRAAARLGFAFTHAAIRPTLAAIVAS